jgi:hypothetical protein
MKTDEKIEEIIQDNLLSLVEFDGDNEKGFGTAVDVSIAHRNIMEAIDTEVQKQVEDGIRGFVKEYVNQLRISPRPENVAPLLRYMKTYLQSLDKGDK